MPAAAEAPGNRCRQYGRPVPGEQVSDKALKLNQEESQESKKMINSDAAILILNFYPPGIVKRAVDSVVRQDFEGTWTIYLGFHDRSAEHKAAVREQFQGLPVEYVDIDKDLVSDTRAKNVILQEARSEEHTSELQSRI